MDYKTAYSVMNWHAKYAKFNGTEFKLICYMVTESRFKEKTITASYNELADGINSSRAAVISAIKSLKKFEAISEIKKGAGRGACTYKIRTAEELDMLYSEESHSIEWCEWDEERERLFDDVTTQLGELHDECEECEQCKEDGDIKKEQYCAKHEYKKKKIHGTKEYKRMVLWESDNPEPPIKTVFVNGYRV